MFLPFYDSCLCFMVWMHMKIKMVVIEGYPKALIYRLSWWLSVFIASATAQAVHSRRRQDRRKVFMRKQIGGTGI